MNYGTNSLIDQLMFIANRYLLSSNYDSHHSRAHTFIQVVRGEKNEPHEEILK